MTRKTTIIALVGQEAAKEIMKLVGTAQAKYLLTDKGAQAKKTSNSNYREKVKKDLAEASLVKEHLKTINNAEFQTLTELWNHYRKDYLINDKVFISRSHYKLLLKELNVEIVNPHIRSGIKYYSPAYKIERLE